ncbi:MAG: hypothetical protein JW953_07740 [Anaerolineae bacterium]|nr:hypothetical protein [Anaerolineae bacterium]
MDQVQYKVLQLVAAGAISAEEGERLLAVLNTAGTWAGESISPGPARIETRSAPFDFPPRPVWARYQAALLVPGGTLVIIGLGAIFLVFGGPLGAWWLLLILPVMLVGVCLLLLAWWSEHNRWLHLRVKTEDVNFGFNLPLPLSWLVGGFKIARFFEPRLAMVTDDALDALVDASAEGIFHVEVDEDKEYVQVYYG